MDYLQLEPAAWRLRFPKEVEKEYAKYYYVANLNTIKISLTAGLFLYASFGLLDRIAIPSATHTAWFYRFLLGCPAILAALISSYSVKLKAYLQLVISCACIIVAATVIRVIHKSQPTELAYNHYYVGLIIIMMFTGSWARLRFWYGLTANTMIFLVHLVVALFDQDMVQDRLLILNNHVFLLSAHFVASATCYFFEVNSRIDFLQRKTIEAEKNTSNTQREVLEQQAEQLAQVISSLETTQAQLVQREKMASLGELTAGIAHEIQNPLNFVNNFAEVSAELATELQAEVNRPEPDRALLLSTADDLRQNQERIKQHGRRAATIVRDMLAHARTSKEEPTPTDLNALAEESLRLAYHSLRAKDPNFNATMSAQLDPALGLVEVVPQDIDRVFLNLLTNAFYAVRKKAATQGPDYRPDVQVSTRRCKKQVEVRVRDNGMGIPAAIQEKIFQPFFTTKPTGEGTGLGLSLSYDIVTKGHRGSLAVLSQEGQFTEFIVTLPQVQKPLVGVQEISTVPPYSSPKANQ
ncbi:ATP-binding protein [Hymenobacter sp. YC55]|uniref:sensor histidine kinase n=1 Tax=Hymenobacter sp. YC55 TaxID=3034019 RepID=UPI0023FA06DE|nr:ATP-binding protein [Hymenobacter sp. YC55]MDF7811894.1 ATP-binding protein [Hymenobacter sp. YC55]